MTTTPNLHLPQFAASDCIHHDDFNDAFAKLDTALKANADAITTLGTTKADASSLTELIRTIPIVVVARASSEEAAAQIDLDLSDIDLSDYHRLDVYVSPVYASGYTASVSLLINNLTNGYTSSGGSNANYLGSVQFASDQPGTVAHFELYPGPTLLMCHTTNGYYQVRPSFNFATVASTLTIAPAQISSLQICAVGNAPIAPGATVTVYGWKK